MNRHLAPWLLVLLTATGGCATMNVSSHMAVGLNTTPYHTFAWGTPDALPAGDPRLDQNPFFKDHVEGAVEKQLGARGIRLTTDQPDLQIHYHAVITPRLDVNRVDREYGYCYDGDCDVRVFDYEEGTLVIDIIDARTHRMVWRGWAQNTVEAALKNQDRMAQQIDTAVARMLARFPQPLTGDRNDRP